MQINIKSDINKLKKDLNNIQRKQIPFAASQAINDTAIDAQKALKAQAPKKLDRPTRQTINSFRVKRSTKRNLTGEVFILPWAWAYLKYQIEGGTRRVSGKGTGVPVNARLNKFGNIPARKKGLVKKKKQFIATIRGIAGVWERTGRGGKTIKLITAFEKSVQYEARFPFSKIVKGVVKNRFNKHMNKRLQLALATAR